MLKFVHVIAMAALFSLAASAALSRGAGDEWESLNQKVISLYQQGQYDRGIAVAKQALELAEKNAGKDHPDVAESLENMAALYRATKQDKKAKKLERRAARIRAKER